MLNSYIALGYDCNHKCICCPLSTYDRLHAPLDLKVLREQIEVLFGSAQDEMGVTISGGEPTMHRDFISVLELLGKKNAYITVLSNAATCIDRDFVRQIKEALGENIGRFEYITAIHSSDAVLHDRITGVYGSLEQSLRGLDNLIEEEIHVSVKHIMSGMTYKTMRSAFACLNRRFPTSVAFHFCAMDYVGRCAKHVDDLFVGFRELQPYLEETLDLWDGEMQGYNREINVYETPLCAADPYYWRFFSSTQNGRDKYLAPGTDDRLTEVVSECHTGYAPCMECDVREMCEGVWRSAYEIGKNYDNFFQPVKALNTS